MSKDKQEKTLRQNKVLYITLIAASLVVIIVAIILSATSANGTQTLSGDSVSVQISRTSSQSGGGSASARNSTSQKPSSSVPDKTSTEPEPEPQPTAKEVYFIMPVENGTCIKDFTEASVVYNKTLGIYTGHMGMDITGESGARVLCVYDGEVVSITSSYLQGTTVTVSHGNGLKTVYNSVEVDENLSVGDKLKQGDVIGVISENNRQEYKDGAHLHFEVEENGAKVSPTKYFNGYDK